MKTKTEEIQYLGRMLTATTDIDIDRLRSIIEKLQEIEVVSTNPKREELEELITVCNNCEKASCWHGYFMCDSAVMAGTKNVPKSELLAKKLEHPSYITNDEY